MILDPIPGSDRVIIADDPRLLDWCADRIPHVGSSEGWRRDQAVALGVGDHGNIIAVMVVHGYNRTYGDAQISMAADTPRWATKATIAKLLDYPFGQLGCQRITTLIPARNTRALRFNTGLGFKMEGVVRRGFGDDDCIVMGLLREDAPSYCNRTGASV